MTLAGVAAARAAGSVANNETRYKGEKGLAISAKWGRSSFAQVHSPVSLSPYQPLRTKMKPRNTPGALCEETRFFPLDSPSRAPARHRAILKEILNFILISRVIVRRANIRSGNIIIDVDIHESSVMKIKPQIIILRPAVSTVGRRGGGAPVPLRGCEGGEVEGGLAELRPGAHQRRHSTPEIQDVPNRRVDTIGNDYYFCENATFSINGNFFPESFQGS